MKNRSEIIFTFLFFVFLFLIIIRTYKDYGITWDEGVYLNVGRHYVTQLINFFKIPNNLVPYDFFSQYPKPYSLIHIQSHGVVFDMVFFSLLMFFKTFSFENYHLIKALVSVLALVFIYLSVRKLINWHLALVAVALTYFFPQFYGHIFTNPADIPAAILVSGTVFSATAYFFDIKSFRKLVLLSFFLGLLISQRIIFLYVFFLALFSVFIYYLAGKKIAQALKNSFLIVVFTAVFTHLTHPYLLTHPIRGIFTMFKVAKLYPWTAANLFEGKMVTGGNLPWYYLIKMILITSPLSITVIFLTGSLYLLLRIISKKTLINKKVVYFFLLSLFYLPLIITAVFRPVIYDSWRQFLFLTIPLIIISAFGLFSVNRLKIFWLKLCLYFIISVNLLITAVTMIRLHPYEYIYYNSLIGGLRGAYRQYETDYWGAGFKEAVLWFNKNINRSDKTYLIKVEGDKLSSSFYFKSNMQLVDDPQKADYIFTFTRWNLDHQYPGRTIYKVQRDNVPLIFIKEGVKNL